jgi:hypothetical protein
LETGSSEAAKSLIDSKKSKGKSREPRSENPEPGRPASLKTRAQTGLRLNFDMKNTFHDREFFVTIEESNCFLGH